MTQPVCSTQECAPNEIQRAHLATATTMYREMGMTFWLEKAEAEMTELGR
jgi:hypothetical protein